MAELTFMQTAEKLSDLQPFIQYCIDTDESEWQIDVVRNKGNTKNCMFGHLVNWFHGKDYGGNVSRVWDLFEEMWMTTYVIYPINDGRNPKYQQSTPKQRVIAYLKDLYLGQTEDTQTGMANECAKYNLITEMVEV